MATYYWRGSTGSFLLPSGWMVADTSGTLSPASAAPGDGDTAVFDTTGATLSADTAFSGLLQMELAASAGALNLAGHTLALLGTAQFGVAGGRITGPGTLETEAISALPAAADGGTELLFTDGAVWSNAGLVIDAGIIGLGSGAGDTATVINQPGALFALATDQSGQIATAAGGMFSFINNGTLAKTGGTGVSSLTVPVTNAGVITANSGTLELDGGGTLGGILGGDAGEVRVAGTYTLAADGTSTVSFGSGVVLGGAADGAAVLSGAGTLASSGPVQIGDGSGAQLVLTGGATWTNAGSVSATSDIAFGADGGTLINQAGGSLIFTGDAGIGIAAAGSDGLVNRGILGRKGSGTSRIAVPITDIGSIVLAGGTLELDAGGTIAGPVNGAGSLALVGSVSTLQAGGSIAAGALLIQGGTLLTPGGATATVSSNIGGSSGTVLIAGGGQLTLGGTVDASQTIVFGGAGATLTVANISGFNPVAITGFGVGDALLVVDSSTNVISRLATLETLARSGILTAISFTDAGTPALSLSATQLGTDLDALAKIVTPYRLAAAVSWAADQSGTFDNPALWSGGALPDASSDAVIDFADQPTITYASGYHTLHTLTNMAGHLVMTGGTLELGLLSNQAELVWNGGSIDLDGSDGDNSGALNGAGAVLSIVPNGQRVGGIGSIGNAGTILVNGGTASASLDTFLMNTGSIVLTHGTLQLNGGGSSSGDGILAGAGGTLAFGGGSFAITAGRYAVANTTIGGGTLDLSAAADADFGELSISAGGLALGNVAAEDTSLLRQAGGTLSGGDTLSAFAGAQLTGGLQTGPGTTRLLGPSTMSGIALDSGRVIENDSVLAWSAGDILLGGGDSSVATHAGTLSNAGMLRITADAVIGPSSGGDGVLSNAGVISVSAGTGQTDIDTALVNQGILQLVSGTLSLNGGGMSSGALLVNDAAVLRFGTPVFGGTAGAFRIASGGYSVADTVVDGGTLDLSAATSATVAGDLSLGGSGTLELGRLHVTAGEFSQFGNALLCSSGRLMVTGIAQFGDSVQSDAGTTVLNVPATIDGVLQLDGGHTLENDGTLAWNGGSIVLGSGDPAAPTHAGSLVNAAGALLEIAGAGTVLALGSGSVVNAGTLIKSAGEATAITAAVINNGTVLVQSGTLMLDQPVSGNGVFEIDGGAKLEFAQLVGSSESIRFLGGGGTLAVDNSGSFAPPVSGFAPGDLVDLAAVDFAAGATVAFAGGLLSVDDGTHHVAIALLGSYEAAGFQLSSDGHGGVLVGYS